MPKNFQKGHKPLEGCGCPSLSSAKGKKNNEIRAFFRDFVIEQAPEFVKAFNAIDDPKEKCDIYLKATERVIPKISALQFEAEEKVADAMTHLKLTAAWES